MARYNLDLDSYEITPQQQHLIDLCFANKHIFEDHKHVHYHFEWPGYCTFDTDPWEALLSFGENPIVNLRIEQQVIDDLNWFKSSLPADLYAALTVQDEYAKDLILGFCTGFYLEKPHPCNLERHVYKIHLDKHYPLILKPARN